MAIESFDTRGMLLKLEAVENTDAAPEAATNAIQIMNGRSGLQAEKLTRPLDRPFYGAKRSRPVKIRGFIEGDIEIVGSKTLGQASPLSPLFQIAGMAESLVAGPPMLTRYNVISRGIPAASAYFYHAGTFKKILGARANLSGMSMEIGKYFQAKARIEGNCIDVLEAELPNDFDYSMFQEPDPYTTEYGELKVNGVNVEGLSLSVDFGNALGVKEHTEARVARISGREATFTARFYRPAHAQLNVWSLFKSSSVIPIVGTNGIGAGVGRAARMVLRAQIDEPPQEVEADKDYAVEIKGSLVPSDAGNDELQLEFLTQAA